MKKFTELAAGPTYEALDTAHVAILSLIQVFEPDSPDWIKMENAARTIEKILAFPDTPIASLIDFMIFEKWRQL